MRNSLFRNFNLLKLSIDILVIQITLKLNDKQNERRYSISKKLKSN